MPKPPQNTDLPRIVEPRRFARQERVLDGVIAAERCDQLPDIAESVEPLEVSLAFFKDESSRPRIKGRVSTALNLVCQRCLDLLKHEVVVEIDLISVAYEDQVSGLPADAEWILAEEDSVDLIALLEEEIMLELPLVPLHQKGACEPPSGEESDFSEVPVEKPKDNPFKVLEQLKAKQDKS